MRFANKFATMTLNIVILHCNLDIVISWTQTRYCSYQITFLLFGISNKPFCGHNMVHDDLAGYDVISSNMLN